MPEQVRDDGLRSVAAAHISGRMDSRYRLCWLALGWFLVVLSPVVGVLPGPGGIFLFAGGLMLLLRHSAWIRRHYARLSRRYPRLAGISNRALRRESARRRRLRDAPPRGGID